MQEQKHSVMLEQKKSLTVSGVESVASFSEVKIVLTLLGGEPMEPINQAGLLPFVEEVRRRFPEKTIWCYTGYTFDENTGGLQENHVNTPDTKRLISLFDVLIDGAYVEELHDIRLRFRGSSNQRVIDVQKSLTQNRCVLYLE